MNSLTRRMPLLISATAAVALASSAFATVNGTLVADAYIVKDGAGANAVFYSVIDLYIKGNHLGDVANPLTGLSTYGFELASSLSTKDGGGAVTGDKFKQAGNSSWSPSYTGTNSGSWDSFVSAGARQQSATVTNVAGTVKDIGGAGQLTGATDFTQFSVANSNYINSGFNGGWLPTGLGSGAYSTSGTAQNPFARISAYNATWAPGGAKAGLAYSGSTLNRSDIASNGLLTNGRVIVGSAPNNSVNWQQTVAGSGATLDNHFMLARLSIAVSDLLAANADGFVTLHMQGNMTGRNGTGDNAGTVFTGASNTTYKANQYFTFAVPSPGTAALIGLAGLITVRRRVA